jgi:hypothetical protein
MGYYGDMKTTKPSFDPHALLTKAEVGTIFSRMLWSDTYA